MDCGGHSCHKFTVDVGSKMSEGRLEHIRTLVDTWVYGNTHPGALVGIYDDDGKELFYHERNTIKTGFTEGENAVSFNKETIFRIYSMTKPVTGVAAMILVDRGLLSVDDEVSKWIPSFKDIQVHVSGDADNMVTEPPATPMTIYHLLTHTSGIVYGFFGHTAPDKVLVRNLGPDFLQGLRNTTLADLAESVAKSPLKFQPGTGFEYGLNLDILGYIIELASGRQLDEFFKEEIFEPLGMVDTDFYCPAEKWNRMAKCYEHTPGMGFKRSLQPTRNELWMEKPINLAGGGGLVSTIGDYAKFTTCLLNQGAIPGTDKRIVSAASVAHMTRNVLPNGVDIHDLARSPGFLEVDGGGFGFGLSMYVLTDPHVAQGGILSGRGEFGWGGMASTAFFVDPVYKFSAILMTQLTPSNSYPIRGHLRYLSHWALQDRVKENETTKAEST